MRPGRSTKKKRASCHQQPSSTRMRLALATSTRPSGSNSKAFGVVYAIDRERARVLQVGAQHADVAEFVGVVVRHQNTAVGQQSKTLRAAEPRLRRSAVPMPVLAVAHHRAHLLQIRAQKADAVVVVA